jgi:predicted DNA-binding transcriptional regulator AlpA
MEKEPLETVPDVLDVTLLADVLHLSKAGAYNLLNRPDFPTLHIGGRKLVMKNDLLEWLQSHTNRPDAKHRHEP